MKIKPDKIKIEKDSPFAEDLLKREESAKILTQLISSIEEPFVLAVDSPWGTGKSTFIKMWCRYLKDRSYPCLYISAWENDFSDDPLVSLIGELDFGLDTIITDKKIKPLTKKYFDKAMKVGKALVKKSIPTVINVGTAGVVDGGKVYDAVVEGIIDEVLDKYKADKDAIKKFRGRLSDFVNDLTSVVEGEQKKSLVIFIDELDRCRPDFAIKLLEKAKHFFNVEGIIFVLAIDKEQIGHSIRSIYGVGMDVDGYLRRFIDLEYRLPIPKEGIFCKALFKKFGFDKYFAERKTREASYEPQQFLDMFAKLSSVLGLSLRVQEQCFIQIGIVLRTTPANYKLYPLFLAALVALKADNPKLYKDYLTGIEVPEKVLEFLKEKYGGVEVFDSHDGKALEAYFVAGRSDRTDLNAIIDSYNIASSDAKKSDNLRARLKDIAERLNSMRFDDTYDFVEYLVKKIEIYERFVAG